MERPDLATIPTLAGVYMYKDAQGHIIYVGKARHLRRRVASYFRPADQLTPKTVAMLRHACTIDILTTTTEKEALLLEASLIKKHRPRYNIVLRDDKSYALFRIARKHPYPRLEIVRQVAGGKGGFRRQKSDNAHYFGPFTSSLAARETWKVVQRAFPLRRCSDRAFANRVRPCLYHHMGQCFGPCVNDVAEADYASVVENVVLLLSGKSDALLQDLRGQMEAAAEILDFERAADLRDQLRAVERTVERQAVVLAGGGELDVIGIAEVDGGLALGLLFVREGRLIDGRTFFWPSLALAEAPELLLTFITQFYGVGSIIPSRIIVPWLPHDAEDEPTTVDNDGHANVETISRQAIETALAELRGGHVRIMTARNADEHRLIDMACSNATEAAHRAPKQPLADMLMKAVHASRPIVRIEAVDVSHTGGKNTRVGMVVFEDGQPLKSDYRNYAFEDGGGDDYGILAAWAERRAKAGPPWADLVLVDGGRGQLAAVERAFMEAGVEGHFTITSIAKARTEDGRADRRAGNVSDRIFLAGRANPLPLRDGSPELLFLQHVRDTVHDYSIGRHRKARGKAALQGELQRMEGIGPKTAKLLWEAFPSLEAMRDAGADGLAAVQGIGPRKAAMIHERLVLLLGKVRSQKKT
ncbi:MAG: excinuclease ABC subunit UvrC [Pseudomonadota bacterium]